MGSSAVAQTALTEGDLAVVAVDPYDADGFNDQFSFVLLTAVEDGTEVRFSDYDYDEGTDSFSDDGNDGELLVTLNALPAGTVVTVNVSGPTALQDGSQGSVVVSDGGFGLSQFSGDTVVAFQGVGFTAGAPNPVAPRADDVLFFVDAGDAGVTGAPSALGDDAATSFANRTAAYDARASGADAPTSGTAAALFAAFGDESNYVVQNGNIDPATYLPDAFAVTDGTPTITVSPSTSAGNRLAVPEDGSRTFTVTLSQAPSSDVTVPLSSSDPGEATVPASVVVAAGTTSQTFAVTGAADVVVDGDQDVTVTTGPATGDPAFADVDPADVFVTVTDVDVDLGTELAPGDLAIVAVAPVNGGSSSVGGNDGEEFTFVLLTDVEDGTQVNFSDYTVSANGAIAEGSFDGIATVTLNALPAGAVVTANLNTGQLRDPSQGTLAIVEGGFILSEFAGDAFFAYQGSATAPAPDDFLYYTELPDGGSVPPDALDDTFVFQPGNLRGFFYDAQGSTEAPTSGSRDELLAAFNDEDNYVLPQRVVGSDDADRDPLDFVPDAVDVLDGEGSVTVSPLAVTVSESGTAATFSVTLSRSPGADVTIDVSSGNAAEATVSPAQLTFQEGTDALTQTVTVTGVDDEVTDGDQTVTVAVQTAESRDAGYDGEDPDDVVVTVTDVGGRDNTVQFAAVQQAVLEGAGSVDLVVEVADTPDVPTDVVVTLAAGDPDDLGGFTSATVTLGGDGDGDGDGDGAGEDGRYVVTVPVTDDVRPEDTETFLFELSVEDTGDEGFVLEVGSRDQTAVVVVDDDGDAVTVAVPAGAGPRVLAAPVGGVTAGELADAAGVGVVYVLDGTGFVAAAPDAVLSAGQPVLVGGGGALELTGTAPPDALAFGGTAVADGQRVVVPLANPTAAPVSLAGLGVEGGALADVALVFDGALGAFRPVSLGGLEADADGLALTGDLDGLALGAFSVVVLQVAPDGDGPVSVTLAPGDGETGTPVGDLAFRPVEGETAVVLELAPQPSSDVVGTAGDVAVLRVGVGGDGLDPFDGADVTTPLGGTLAAVGLVDPSALWAALSVGDLTPASSVTVPLAVAVPEPGFYQITLGSAPAEIDGRPVTVEVFEGTRGVAVEDGTAFRFRATAADTVALSGRFSARLSLGAGVDGEAAPETPALSVFPNPSAGPATVALTSGPGPARVAVYDALGRQVVVLHDGPTAGGEVRLPVHGLAPGTYVVRATGDGFAEARRLTVVR